MAFPFAALGTGLGVISSGLQLFKGAKQEREAQKAIQNFNRQELTNPFDNVRVSTLGSDVIRDESRRFSANAIEAARAGGLRSVVGALPRIQAANNDINRDAAVELDDQIRENEILAAQQASRNQEILEQRDREELAGLGQRLAVGQQNFFSGLSGLSNLAFSADSLLPKPGLD